MWQPNFGDQDLGFDAALLASGTDLMRVGGQWSHARVPPRLPAAQPREGRVRLRVNAYRVLLILGRDGTVVFVPPLPETDETFDYLAAAGFTPL